MATPPVWEISTMVAAISTRFFVTNSPVSVSSSGF